MEVKYWGEGGCSPGLTQSNNWFNNGPIIITSRRSAKNMLQKKKAFFKTDPGK